MKSPTIAFAPSLADFELGCDALQPQIRSNTGLHSEPLNALEEPDWDSPLPDSYAEALMIRFLFVQGQPGPKGFLLKDTPVKEVFVAGDFNGWDPTSLPLEQYDDGYWEADIPLAPGRHEYIFVADGCWRPDPMADSVPNPFGGVNSVVNVPQRD
jgi:hypothetical protein